MKTKNLCLKNQEIPRNSVVIEMPGTLFACKLFIVKRVFSLQFTNLSSKCHKNTYHSSLERVLSNSLNLK